MSNADRKKQRPSKKTEMLEVRVAPEEKAAFLEACRKVGRSASEVIRDAMRAYSDFGPMNRLPRSGLLLVSAFLGASAGAYALVAFLDADHAEDANSAIAYRQFREIDTDLSDTVTRAEYRRMTGSLAAIIAGSSPAEPAHSIRRASAIGQVFVGYDINYREILRDPSQLGEACVAAASVSFDVHHSGVFERIDRDGSGEISAEEFIVDRYDRVMETFEYADMDGDGYLTPADARLRAEAQPAPAAPGVARSFRQPEPAHIAVCRADVGGFDPQGVSSSARGELSAADHWRTHSRFDTNGDGRVDFSEYATRIAGI
ncbi:hypothetical protein [Maricaulis sp.]|uniref:hypothetical protein n=1 Tax=Maricaulis sp. TaxID=1486257 RepID=UPI00261CA5E0|nr:hypothetical protein [Maricaulis sp.]